MLEEAHIGVAKKVARIPDDSNHKTITLPPYSKAVLEGVLVRLC